MKQVEVVARSQEQALAKAGLQLGVEPGELHVVEEYEPDEIDLQNLAKEEEAAGGPAATGEPVLYVVNASPVQFVKAVQELVGGLVARFQPGATVEVFVENGAIRAAITAEEASLFIGKHGYTLGALQHVAARMLTAKFEDFPQLILDVGDYRRERLAKLEEVARRTADKAIQTRRSVSLKPMPAQDRKFVHTLLKTIPGITTKSYGHEPDRYLVIEVEGAREGHDQPRGDRGNRGGRGGGRSGRRPDGQGGRGENRGGGGRRDDNFGNRDNRRGGGGGRGRSHNEDDDNRGNRISSGNRRGGQGPRHDDDNRGNRIMDEPKPKKTQLPAWAPKDDDNEFSDVEIEEKASRLPAWKEGNVDPSSFDPEKPMVDELE